MMLPLSVLRNNDDLNDMIPLVIVEITISPTIGKEIILYVHTNFSFKCEKYT